MRETADEPRRLLDSQPKPVCAALTPFTVVDADFDSGFVTLEFAQQSAFRNHFGNIQGGFAVPMLDTVVSIAAYAKLRQWLPTISRSSRVSRANSNGRLHWRRKDPQVRPQPRIHRGGGS